MMPDITKYFKECIMNDEKLVWRYAKNETSATIKSAGSQVSGILSPGIEGQESSEEDDEQILSKLETQTGNLMQRAFSLYLYKALKEKKKEQDRMQDDFTIGVFGECGQGKSTLLNKIYQVYKEKYNKDDGHIVFDASPSLMSVTSVVKIAKSGNMTLIDSPGFNDPNKLRTDKAIFMDLVNTIRGPLKSRQQGISMFI